MSIVSPNLDTKTFQQLRDDALEFARQRCPDWSDRSPHDPGVVLTEVFAFLTEALLFRMNRLPRKAFIEFLKLIGLRLQPPSAASVTLTFFTGAPATRRIPIPRGTRVTSSGADGPVFVTDRAAWVEPGQTEARVVAHHCEVVDGELLGTGTGLPGLALPVKRPPIVASVPDAIGLGLGVEADPADVLPADEQIHHGGRVFRRWREVESFTLPAEEPHVFIVDRVSGLVSFAPAVQGGEAALGAIPAAGREIRVWYRRGGGPAGNVVAGTLDKLKDAVPDVKGVRNDGDATGGGAAESVENALVRGPAELHSLQRAVTARDFEALVRRERAGIALVKAFTQRELWPHARPGTVDVVLIPDVPEEERGESHEHVTAARLRDKRSAPQLERVQKLLDERRPLGTTCAVRWGRLKSVSMSARVGIAGAHDAVTVRARLVRALYRALSPLETTGRLRRGFGERLRVGDIYAVLQAEPGVGYVGKVVLSQDVVPGASHALAVDPSRAGTFYAGCDNGLFRSTNRGDSWEQVFPGAEGKVVRLALHPAIPGLLAIVTERPNEPSRIHLSRSAAEDFSPDTRSLRGITDLGFTTRDGGPVLLVTAETGLHEVRVRLDEGTIPGVGFDSKLLPVVVDAGRGPLGFRALVTGTDERGTQLVALSAIQAPGGIYLSASSGATGTFRDIGLRNEDVRVLELQRVDSATFLWAGTTQPGRENGKGCFRRELDGTAAPARPWDPIAEGWIGSSVNALAFDGSRVYAASFQRGVCVCDARATPPRWRSSDLGGGLPENNAERLFHSLWAIAVEPLGAAREPFVLTGGPHGLFRRQRRDREDERERYVEAAPREVDEVLVPRDWLICSGTHTVTDTDDAGEAD